jgi:TorA maturation chaperone TorD
LSRYCGNYRYWLSSYPSRLRGKQQMRGKRLTTRFFGLNLFPYETLFVTAERELGHETTQQVAHTYLESGFDGGSMGGADHIGHELAFVAFLCGAEADTWTDDKRELARNIQRREADFLHEHLLRWMAPLSVAVRQRGDAFYTAVVAFLQDFLASHAADLPLPTSVTPLPQLPDILTNPDTRLKGIARFLLTPAYTGFVLTRDDLNQWGRTLDLPRGFGSRRQMLQTLLESAGRYEQWENLVTLLNAHWAHWAEAYESDHGRVAMLRPYIMLWQDRLSHTRSFLAQLHAQAQTAPS